MVKKSDNFPSTFTIDNFSSTATLTNNDQIKVPVTNKADSIIDKVYDPYEHRSLEHPNTFLGALVHLIKGSLGIGILSVPRAFKSAGLITGFLGTIIIGFICTHTIHILVRASQDSCVKLKTPSLGFAETAEAVFMNGPKSLRKWSRTAKNWVEGALILTYYCGNAVYIVFISESIVKLVSFYHPPAADWTQYFKLMILVPLIICCQVRELKHLVPFSFIANINMVVAFAITLYYTFFELKKANVSDRHLANDISNIPSFFSTIIFAMEGIGTILPVENSMLRDQFVGCPGVLNSAMTIVTMLFVAMGFFGYLSYGETTAATITQNLPSDEIPAQVVQACISISVFFTFMLQFYVPIDITWRRIKDKIPEKRHQCIQIILRSGIVTMIVAVAAAAGHHLDVLIDLVGAIFLSTLGLMVPAIIDLVVYWKNWGTCCWILIKDVLIISLSLFGLLSGTFYAIENVLKEQH